MIEKEDQLFNQGRTTEVVGLRGATSGLDRRSFLGTALGAVVTAGATASGESRAQQPSAGGPGGAPGPGLRAGPNGAPAGHMEGLTRPSPLFRAEMDIADCEVEGKLPADLNGTFHRVGPDPQYPLAPGNIPFDGEGHVSMFHFKDGHVTFKSRFVQNQRYVAQAAAHRILFPMYRNPYVNDPSVKDLSRGTANTHLITHNGMLLAFKEDSPPVAMNPLTLETVDPYYTFDGQLESKTFTAHPKIDSENGNMIAFGYEAKGFATDDVNVFEYTPQGKKIWSAWIKVPYIGLLHDFAVTKRHVIFYVFPLAIDMEQMRRGGIHWSWDGTKPTWWGVMRRGGDGKDIRWFKGPERSATHVMGAFEDGDKVYVDMEMSAYNPFPFMPFRDGTKWDYVKGASHITRLSADLSKKSVSEYKMEVLYPHHVGALPRQDDRYNTAPYRIGFLPCPDPSPAAGKPANFGWARFDHQTRATQFFDAGEQTTVAEACFAPRNKTAPEGSGYLMGVATRHRESGRSDLIILDAERLNEGPIAIVRLPTRIVGQIHGWWTPEEQLRS
jgi:carotenoid cleavage dioxygenase-like enzyme